MSMTEKHAFQGRLWLIDYEFDDEFGPPLGQFWVFSLDPVDFRSRPISEWIEEDFRESNFDLWSEFNLDRDKNWQVLVNGTIAGYWDGEEYDSKIDLEMVECIEIPDSFFEVETLT